MTKGGHEKGSTPLMCAARITSGPMKHDQKPMSPTVTAASASGVCTNRLGLRTRDSSSADSATHGI